jgi:hypothetical protein
MSSSTARLALIAVMGRRGVAAFLEDQSCRNNCSSERQTENVRPNDARRFGKKRERQDDRGDRCNHKRNSAESLAPARKGDECEHYGYENSWDLRAPIVRAAGKNHNASFTAGLTWRLSKAAKRCRTRIDRRTSVQALAGVEGVLHP